MEVKNIKITDVNQFSDRDRDYYINSSKFSEFLQYDFDYNQFSSVFNNRKEYDIDRQTLVRVLNAQYEGVESSALTQDNIKVLNENKTFTVTTAHQPSLLGGPLYYIYKILSAIKLSQRLNADYPGKRVIPVFVIGGEDHDFEEINHLHVFGKKIEWSSKDSGPVGRFSVEGIEEVINHVKDILGENSKVRELCDNLKAFAQKSDNYAAFSFKFTHALFDKFGLVILRMDELDFKRNFIPSIKKEVLESPSKEIIAATQEKINALDYKAQTHIRDINFFYVKAGFRNRIEKEGDLYKIVDKDITFSEQEMIKEIENHPERFSPNVIMRPLFQSLTLPDLAYIGGGGELAYWMERKSHFALFGMHFPMLIRRKSAMILSAGDIKQSEKLGLSINALFGNENDLIKTFLSQSANPDFDLSRFKDKINTIYEELEKFIVLTDSNLGKTTQAEAVKSIKSIDYLESKLRKSIKQKEEVNLKRISKIKGKLFPSGLQERHDNIMEYMSLYGTSILDKFLDHCDPFDKNFKVFIMQQGDR